jgi:hypothetical protein
MILVKLHGGMGNQLFQYAAGRRLALHNNDKLLLDLSEYQSNSPKITKRQFELSHFKAPYKIADKKTLSDFKRSFIDSIKTKVGLRSKNYVERSFAFDPAVLSLKGDICLDGFWQSEKYFADIKNQIKTDFQIKKPLSGKNLEIADLIKGSNSVALHIRRGDYVKDQKTMQFHGVCSLDYYKDAANLIKEKAGLSELKFFVFSDDPAWAKENLKLDDEVLCVDHNGSETAFEDLRLVSLCQYFIIANSTFSWWGAWLSQNEHKIVVAPKRWFSDETVDTNDIYPKGWVRL